MKKRRQRSKMSKARWPVLQVLWRNPRLLRARPALNLFFLKYTHKFRPQKVGDHIILHSHLPPLNSPAYARFIDVQLLGRAAGPSHAQVGLTNACPQQCGYCYNRERTGRPLDTATLLSVVRDLKDMGVVWMGWTGGEPLLNKDILLITEKAADGCAVKLFTTGSTLTPGLAGDLKNAGLFSVSVSLDHWKEDVHDGNRGVKGAFATALRAIDMFRNVDGLHVGVSAVLSRDMIRTGQTEEFLEFLERLDIHEAWLSETKPSVAGLWNDSHVITEEERLGLVRLQDRYNKRDGMTVNFLGHFEAPEHFGCNAGHKMVYVDSFGEVSPCVFTPLTMGNVRDRPLPEIFQEMRTRFPSEDACFINKNYKLLQSHTRGRIPIPREDALEMLRRVRFGPWARFFALYYSSRSGGHE
jgi:MoaA/NifB/PqqE/SkfB family radical SAM enzyme